MLAYTTVSDTLYVPSVLEVIVYVGGLMLVLALPMTYLTLTATRDRKATSHQQPQGSDLT